MYSKAELFLETVKSYFNQTIKDKKFILIYFVLCFVVWISLMKQRSFTGLEFETLFLIIMFIVGGFCIIYYSKHNKEVYKVAFCIILCFGLICCFATPLFDVCDEGEHFIRSEITSHGDFIAVYDNGFDSIASIGHLKKDQPLNVFEAKHAFQPINYTPTKFFSGFQQNPFYGYIAQGIGVDIAKILNLDAVWMLWLGRVCNLILYAAIIAIAIKKTPILKIPMLVMACIPLAIYQTSSVSIDALINGLGFLIIAYLFYIFKCSEKTLDTKDIVIFAVLCLLLSLCKGPYLAFVLFLLIIPRNKFKQEKSYYLGIVAIAVVVIITLIWSKYVSTPNMLHSYRFDYFKSNNINSTLQVSYLINHPGDFLAELTRIPTYIPEKISKIFELSYFGNSYSSKLVTIINVVFLIAVTFLYPREFKLPKRFRFFSLLIVLIVVYGIYVVELLIWTPVGEISPILGVQVRYFIPLLPLLPFIFGFNNSKGNIKKINKYIVVISILLAASLILTMLVLKY